MSEREQCTLRGVVTRLFTKSPNFAAGKILPAVGDVTRRREVSFAGKVFVALGESVILVGAWVDDKKFGRQFKVARRVYEEALDVDGLATWLAAHADASGIGPVKAERIAREFGEDFGCVLKDNPEQIAIFAGVRLESVRKLGEVWHKHEELNRVGTKLATWGLSAHQVNALYAKFGGGVVALLETDPYLIVREVPGFGFKKVDSVARRLGVMADHPGRLDTAILHVLGWTCSKDGGGHTCMEESALLDEAVGILELDEGQAPAVGGRLGGLVESGAVRLEELGGAREYSTPWLHRCEWGVTDFLRRSKGGSPLEIIAESLADEHGPGLDDSQRRALITALSSLACLISGGAGSGKTTVIRSLSRAFIAEKMRVSLCAPTGKAARRLEEVVGTDASTIHKLLGYRGNTFIHCATCPLAADVVIVDEVSMMGSELTYHLLSALKPGTVVVLVGDHHQLPPVGPGAVLRDCIDNDLLPMAILEKCHRQAGALKKNAAAILSGEVARTEPWEGDGPGPWYVDRSLATPEKVLEQVEKLFTTTLVEKFGLDVVRDVQFLSPQKRGPLGTWAIRALLQKLHQKNLGVIVPPPPPDDQHPPLYVGDKVIQVTNDYELDIMNGSQGVVLCAKPLVVLFDGREVAIPGECWGNIELAYCLTAHKCQGSEFPCVVVVCHKLHAFCLHRNWLYTACTRARQTCVILGDDRGIRNAAAVVKTNERRTLLARLAKNHPRAPALGGAERTT